MRRVVVPVALALAGCGASEGPWYPGMTATLVLVGAAVCFFGWRYVSGKWRGNRRDRREERREERRDGDRLRPN